MRAARSAWRMLLLLAALALVAAAQQEADEFEDVADAQQAAPFVASGAGEGEAKAVRRRAPLEFGPLEYAGLATFVLYVLNYLIGKSTNNGLAKRCSDAFRELLTQQFSHVGPAQPADELDASKASASIFFSDAIHKHTAFCTGRRYCQGMIVDVELQKRQDLVSLLIGMFYPEKDLLVLQTVMEDSMEPIVMAIVPSKHSRNIRNEQSDLKDFTGAVTLPGLEEPLAALGEDAAVAAKLVPADMIKLLNDNAKMIELIHVTDQNVHPVPGWKDAPKKMITFKFRLQSTSDRAVEELRPLVEMALRFIDAAGSMQLSSTSKNKAIERRKKVEDLKFKQTHQQRQELQQQKKLERLQREREMYEHMSEEAKAKYEAKEEKRKKKEERKKQMRVKMIKA